MTTPGSKRGDDATDGVTDPAGPGSADNPGAPAPTEEPAVIAGEDAHDVADGTTAAESDAPDPAEGADAGDEETASAEAEEEDPVEAARREAAERTEDLQRVSAEYANFRRRTARERQSLTGQARAAVIGEFLPVLDDLDLAEKHGDLGGPLKAVRDKLHGVFAKLDVSRFASEGDEFDPEIHEAVQDISSGDDKVVGTVLRPGYMVGDKLARTAMVIIADRAAPAEQDEDPEAQGEA